MFDGLHDHEAAPIVDAVDDPMVAPSGAVQPLQLEPQRASDSMWVLSERPIDELDRRSGHFLGESRQRTKCGPSPLDGEWLFDSGHCRLVSA